MHNIYEPCNQPVGPGVGSIAGAAGYDSRGSKPVQISLAERLSNLEKVTEAQMKNLFDRISHLETENRELRASIFG